MHSGPSPWPARTTATLCCLLLGGLLALWAAAPAGARHLEVRGSMRSELSYTVEYRVERAPGMEDLRLSVVLPRPYGVATVRQDVQNTDLQFSTPPDARERSTDTHGNQVLTARWKRPRQAVTVRFTVRAALENDLERQVATDAPFPVSAPAAQRTYLQATDLVQAEHPRVRERSRALTAGARSQLDAVQAVMGWVVDHMRYVNPPARVDALHALDTGRGNCQNYSHLAAALLRAAGVPVRVANGYTLDNPYDVQAADTTYTFKMGLGRHSWVEVWFPDLGWAPFDPQNSVLFVATRYLRTEVGLDNEEMRHDGHAVWLQDPDAPGGEMRETHSAALRLDRVDLTGRMLEQGPAKLLRLPVTRAAYTPPAAAAAPSEPPAPEPQPTPEPGPAAGERYVFGNLEFPEDVDFTQARTVTGKDGVYESRSSFLVESAEYVTTRLLQYAQVFVLDRPLALERVALALHKYGGSGQLWVELMADEDGVPGRVLAASAWTDLSTLSLRPGYRWQSFDFSAEGTTLEPGHYWIALGFTGEPVVNWFYTFGKPVGPVHGTRYRDVWAQGEDAWSGALSFEFNYKVVGRAVR